MGKDAVNWPAMLERTLRMWCRVALLTVLVTATLLTIFAHPQADDYIRAHRVRELGITQSVRQEYLGWSGRWSGTGLSYATSRFFDLTKHSGAFLLVLNLALPIALYALITALFEQTVLPSTRVELTLWLYALFWCKSPAPGQLLYWFTGNLENQLSISLGVVLVSALIYFRDWPHGFRWLFVSVLCVFAVFITGFHELYGLILAAILAVGTIIAYLNRSPRRFEWLAVCVAALLGFCVVFVAPGNRVRAENFPESGDLIRTTYLTAWLVQHYFRYSMLDGTLLLATGLLVFHPQLRHSSPRWIESNSKYWLLIPVAWMALIVGTLFAVSWVMGKPPYGRTLTVIYLLFLLGWFPSALILFHKLSTRFTYTGKSPQLAYTSGVALFAVFLVARGNLFPDGIKDVMVRAPAYDRAMHARYELIESAVARGERHLLVSPVREFPEVFYRNDITYEPKHWKNEAAASYFGLDSIALDDGKEEVARNIVHRSVP